MIEIVLPIKELKDGWRSRACWNCGGSMISGLMAGTYNFKGHDYRVRRIRCWKCMACGEQGYTSEEAKIIEDALLKKSEELNNV